MNEDQKDNLYYLKELNQRQKEAVLSVDGALLILAGAGAGKTKTITHRILHIIKQGVSADKILAITFTNKASGEMRERVKKLLEEDSTLGIEPGGPIMPLVSTFHSLGVKIIREHCQELSLPRQFTIFDKSDSKQAVKKAIEASGIDPKQYEPSKIASYISRRKGVGENFYDFEEKIKQSYFEEVVQKVWKEYDSILKKEKALDFDDLLLETLKLLNKKEIKEKLNKRWHYISIDEYQDTNKVQYDIAKLLASPLNNIAVVGDLDQAIYSWRGADFKNIMRFEKDFPDSKLVMLEENYRSTKNIIAAANAIISKNVFRKEKNLFTQNPDGDKISIYAGGNEKDEARHIARTAKTLVAQGIKATEICVLFRANFQSRVLEEAFLREDMSYELIGTKFFERKEVKDVMSYLKLALNPDSATDLKRAINTPARGIGKVTLLKIIEGKENELPKATKEKVVSFNRLIKDIEKKARELKPSETIKFIIKESGIDLDLAKEEDGAERIENVRELASIASMYDNIKIEEGIEKFLDHVSLSSDQDEITEKESVKLMTVHASKGLEYDYVFIGGLEQDLFPHEKINESEISEEDKEEERRLFYVALTRARKKLFLSYTITRTIFGSMKFNDQSEFLKDIDDDLIQKENFGGEEKIVYIDF